MEIANIGDFYVFMYASQLMLRVKFKVNCNHK